MQAAAIMVCLALADVSADAGAVGEVVLDRPDVRFGDVAKCEGGVESLALRSLFRVSERGARLSLTAEELSEFVRKSVPALGGVDAPKFSDTIVFIYENERSVEAEQHCAVLYAPKKIGDPIYFEDVMMGECLPERARALMSYERSTGLVRAGADLAYGAYLGSVALTKTGKADRGDPLRLRVIIGPVTVERDVRAVYPIGDQERAFVETDDGGRLHVGTEQLIGNGD